MTSYFRRRLRRIFAAIGLLFLHKPSNCSELQWLLFPIVLIVVNLVSGVLCIALSISSAKGSILEMHKRRNVVRIIYTRVPILILEIISTGAVALYAFGTFVCVVFFYSNTLGFITTDECVSRLSLFLTLAFELGLITCCLLVVVVVFSPLGMRERTFARERRYWSRGMLIFKIRQDDLMRDALDQISVFLAAFFADTEYVLSDILAGLLLLVHSPEKPPSPHMQEQPTDEPEWMRRPQVFTFINRMMDFCVAIYGWPTYLLNNRTCGQAWNLFRQTRCFSNCRTGNADVSDDNCCSCNTVAFSIEANVAAADIYYVCWRNKLYKVPFAVVADHETRSIVVTIRGSASVFDIITDFDMLDNVLSMDVDADPLLRQDPQLDGEGDDETRVHRGMYNSARYVYNVLRDTKVLEDALIINPDYRICVVGHSLGGGVAAILTLLLKQTYSSIRCIAFSPPGCVISETGLADTEAHTLSVLIGDDIVPRMSYESMLRLKRAIDKQLHETRLAKYEILIKGIFKLFFASPCVAASTTTTSERLIAEIEQHADNVNDSEEIVQVESGTAVNISDGDVLPDFQSRVCLFPPGRLLHVAGDESGVKTNWIRKEYLSDIQLTSNCIADHLPYAVRRLLKRTIE